MGKIYLPNQINNNQCVVVQSEGHLRVYSSRPNGYQQNVSYTDYYLRENYLASTGQTQWTQYTSLNCLDNGQFTTDYWYRPDIWQTLICTIIMAYFIVYLPYKIIARLFGRWLKL